MAYTTLSMTATSFPHIAALSGAPKRINGYAREWGASGFRSGFMLRNLDWLHDLDVQYDASTFDTDPFEPQPDGRHTIFPFWVPRPNDNCPIASTINAATPLQEVTLSFPTLCRRIPHFSSCYAEKTTEIWRRKLDWIAAARRNGFNRHASRLHGLGLGSSPKAGEYPIAVLQGALGLYSVKVRRRVLACSASTSRCLSSRRAQR